MTEKNPNSPESQLFDADAYRAEITEAEKARLERWRQQQAEAMAENRAKYEAAQPEAKSPEPPTRSTDGPHLQSRRDAKAPETEPGDDAATA